MEVKEVDIEKSEKIKTHWNEFCQLYENHAENITIQSGIMLYSLTHSAKASKICEVGTGCGKAARMFIADMMKEHSVFFTSDLSNEMNSTFVQRYKQSVIALNPKTKLQYIDDTSMLDIDVLVSDMGEDITRKVFQLSVNNEKLPYPDSYFDRYISNLSMMIVDNHHNQLSESYRVLQPGGIAGFCVWGRPENSSFFTFLPGVIKSMGVEVEKPPRTNFHLGDKEKLVKDVRAAGFKGVKAFYTQTNINFETPEDYYNFLMESPSSKPMLAILSEEQKVKLKVNLNLIIFVGGVF